MRIDAAKLRAARRLRGWTQELLAERAGIARGTVQLIERGKTGEPHAETLFVLAKTLGVSVESLLAPDACAPDAPAQDDRTTSRPADPPRVLGTLPPVPRGVVGREADIAALRARLVGRPGDGPHVLVVDGWPGVGKTTLAAVLAHDAELHGALPDGVLWASLGQSPDIQRVLASWCRCAGLRDVEIRGMKPEDMSARLTHVLRDRRMLIIVDDAWSAGDVHLLRVGGVHASLLVTTRLPALADDLARSSERLRLGVLDLEAGVELLEAVVPDTVDAYPDLCRQLVDDLERLPLALQVAGRLLRAEERRGFTVFHLLKALGEDARPIYESAVPSELAAQTAPTVAALLERSTSLLDDSTRFCFAALGAFLPKPVVFDEGAVRAVWDREDVRETLGELIDRGLVEATEPGRYQMHALVKVHAEAILRSLP